MKDKLTIGITGAGGFAAFAARAFLKVDGVSIRLVFDIDAETADLLAREIGAVAVSDYARMLGDDEIDLVYIATPPYLHVEQSRQALMAGKHVICEKPAALHTSEAEELASFAQSQNLLYVVNLMQRYNPLYAGVKKIIEEKWLGDFVHGFFENYASDERLVPDHWFWDQEKSGGIFIEHGVHFFDMFQGWLGPGQLVHAMEIPRAGTEGKVIDRVQAVVLYGDSPVTFYHGFNQPKILDRQELRLQFDRGDITLYEWVPVKIRMHGVFTTDQFAGIGEMFPEANIEFHEDPTGSGNRAHGKFREIVFDSLLTITSGDIRDKMERYDQLVTSMLKDQWSWIRDHDHLRVMDDTNAVESLRMAEEATKNSRK